MGVPASACDREAEKLDRTLQLCERCGTEWEVRIVPSRVIQEYRIVLSRP